MAIPAGTRRKAEYMELVTKHCESRRNAGGPQAEEEEDNGRLHRIFLLLTEMQEKAK